jgi:sec-independent protein translocase protein TatB
MFDIGLQEIILIGVVALVVLGPEKMPGAVRTLALMIGRLKRSFNALKTEIEKEVGADDIRRQLRNEEIMAKFKHTQAQVQNSISSVKKDVDTFQRNIELEAKAAAGLGDSNGVDTTTPAATPQATTPLGEASPPASVAATDSTTSSAATAATTADSGADANPGKSAS